MIPEDSRFPNKPFNKIQVITTHTMQVWGFGYPLYLNSALCKQGGAKKPAICGAMGPLLTCRFFFSPPVKPHSRPSAIYGGPKNLK